MLLDLACGRGGDGLEIAARPESRLVAVDLSAAAIRQARVLARSSKSEAHFRVGRLEATGLADSHVDAVVCVDAIQLAEVPCEGLLEDAPGAPTGGRAVLTSWEELDTSDERVPARVRAVDLLADLSAAGFVDVDVVERPSSMTAERAMWARHELWTPRETLPLSRFVRKD